MSESKYNRKPEERERIQKLTKELILQRLSLKEICQKTGYSSPTVASLAKSLEVTLKLNPDQICKICGKGFQSKSKKKDLCSRECRLEQIRLDSIIKYSDPETYCECGLCGYRSPDLKIHITKVHEISTTLYKEKTGQERLTSNSRRAKDSERVRGEKNPGFQHGGKFSPFSKNFKNGYDEELHRMNKEKTKARHKEHPELNPFMRQHYNSDSDYIKAQTKNLDWFKEKYGIDEGKKRHSLKTEKQMKSFKKCNFSKISQELFHSIPKELFNDVYFATYEREDKVDYINKEYVLPVGETFVRPDFIDLVTNKIIEFDGDYQHSEAIANLTREKERQEKIEALGYQVLRIKECDYNKDKQKVIRECINFLTQ